MAATLKTALVTGAGSGIGRGIARALDGIGLRLALVGRDQRKLERDARRARRRSGTRPWSLPCDVADRAAVKAMVEQVLEAFGAIDVLVCNAGTNVRNRSLGSARPGRLGPDDRHQPDRRVQPGPRRPARRCGQRQSGLVIQICSISGKRASVARRGRLLGLEVRPGGAGDLPGPRGRAATGSARR